MVSIQSLDSTKVYFISYILCESPGSSPTIPNIEGKKQELRTEIKNKNKEQITEGKSRHCEKQKRRNEKSLQRKKVVYARNYDTIVGKYPGEME